MRWLLWVLVFFLLITVGVCIWFYSQIEIYEFFGETISNLGGIRTQTGWLNPISQWVFTGGFILLGIGSFVMLIGYFKNLNYYQGGLKASILLIFALGAFGVAVPYDHPTLSALHLVGTAMFVGGFGVFNFICQLLRFIRKFQPKPQKKLDYYLDLTFVILVFLALAWYLLSGLFDLIHLDNDLVHLIFHLEISQKILLMISCIAAFLLDLDDM